jgi:hypothetical protein
MIPDAASIARKRYRMRKTLRFMALVLFMIFFLCECAELIAWLYRGAAIDNLALQEFVLYSPFLAGAAFLVIAQGRLIVWLVPIPKRSVCPACGYHLQGLREPRCPECGLDLPPALMRAPTTQD